MDCTNGECAIGQVQVKSQTVRFTASAKLTQWISAGFRVEQSTTTGEVSLCRGKEYERIAVWVRIGRTSYKVRNGLFNACTGTKPHGDVFTITSPNTNDSGSYCVRGHQYVRNLGDNYDETPKPGRW